MAILNAAVSFNNGPYRPSVATPGPWGLGLVGAVCRHFSGVDHCSFQCRCPLSYDTADDLQSLGLPDCGCARELAGEPHHLWSGPAGPMGLDRKVLQGGSAKLEKQKVYIDKYGIWASIRPTRGSPLSCSLWAGSYAFSSGPSSWGPFSPPFCESAA